MEPKDLKNSEELKSPKKEDLKKSEKETSVEKENEKVSDEPITETVPEIKEEKTKAKAKAKEKPADGEESKKKTSENDDLSAVPELVTEIKEETSSEKVEEIDEVESTEGVPDETVPQSVQGGEENNIDEEVQDTKTEEIAQKKESIKEKKAPVETVEKSAPVITEEVKSDSEEKSEEKEKTKKETVDYSKYTQIELVNALRDILAESETHDIREDVDAIKAVFYKNIQESEEAAKKQFIEDGGAEEDFKAEEDPYENDIKELLKDYRQIRIDHNKQLEQEKEENLQHKYEVIEKIKGLINTEESINKTFNEFRDLQQEWREIGLVPQSKMKDLWDLYHFHVENFYDYIKINRELRDLDLKKNLEMKIKLCEKAEELLLDSSIIRAFNTLQKYHEQWREIGPVPREQKEDIWERFKAATTKINKKHQEFFEDRKTEQKENLEAKTALCEKVEEINEKEIDSHKDWDQYSKEIIELQKVWRTIGFAPRKDNNKIYERFRTACDKFFDDKRDFYSKNKEEQHNNLQLKIDLCVQAESLKDSTDWKKTTQDFINIQKKWKEIGPVPRKQSDIIWKRFRTACDYFFDKKSEHFSDVDTEQVDNLKLKEAIIQELKAFKSSNNSKENLESLKEFQRRWSEIGHVPFKKKEEIQTRFRAEINKLYDDLNIDEEKRNILRFRTKMSSFSESSKGQNKMRFERDKYMNKMKQLESDLVTLENNIGFFANSKNAEALIADVNKKIEVTKQKIELLKEKIRVIDDIETTDE